MKGFTLVETLVVLAVMTMMTAMLVLYNRTGERQIVLLREKAQLINTLLRAKGLALNTVLEAEPACGYGVSILEGRYVLYRDKASVCRASDRAYTEGVDEVLTGADIRLPQSVRFGASTIEDVLFVPPNPKVFLNGGQGINEGEIILQSSDGSSSVRVYINYAGQISAE